MMNRFGRFKRLSLLIESNGIWLTSDGEEFGMVNILRTLEGVNVDTIQISKECEHLMNHPERS